MRSLGWLSFLVISLWGAMSAEAAQVTAKSCAASDVQAAINASLNGDTVSVPPGSCVWTSSVSISNSKGIILKGAGIGSTVITGGTCSSSLGHLVTNVASGNAVTRITGFSFDLTNGGCGSDEVGIYVKGGVSAPAFRIDHNRFYNCRNRCVQTWGTPSGDLMGLVDHNTFECPFTGGGCHAMDYNGGKSSDGEGWEAFARPVAFGSANAVFTEDNIFTFADMQDNVFDAYGGARFVFRNNTVTNTMPGVHGADSGSRRGVHSFEVYRNTFTVTTGPNPFTSFNYRSGVILQWGNAWSTKYNEPGRLRIYRITNPESYDLWGMCNGNKVFDGNTTPTGYPCLDQPGWFFDSGYKSTSSGMRLLTPIYFWNNTQAGSSMAIPLTTGLSGYVNNNREFYSSTGASCTGGGSCTTGVGTGTILPATCTTGVAFWKTNEGDWDSVTPETDGVLYKCTATNTWNLYYVPYKYPHPLQADQGGGINPPPAPTNLNVQ